MRKEVKLFSIVFVTILTLMSFTTFSNAADGKNNLYKYSPDDVITALDKSANETNQLNNYQSGYSNDLLDNVLLPRSMNIEVPNIDMNKIVNSTPLESYAFNFKGELVKHGYSKKLLKGLTYDDYRKAEKGWKLDKDQIKYAISLYPELNNIDITNWTNGDFEDYYIKVDQANLESRFSDDQFNTLKQKGILPEDLFYLFKEFYTVDTIMAQSDDTLKNTIQAYYQFKLDNLKELSYSKSSASSTASPATPVTIASTPSTTYYQQQTMPRYGTDWFLKSVCTSSSWLQVQSDRTLKEMDVLYNKTFSSFSGYITNMYGTYSSSQGGAHEGIDFAYGSTGTTIYAIFDGKVQSGGLSHQLSVYDSAAGKSYNYLHMDSKSVSSGANVTHGNAVGKEGMKGNATGPHVHFEVHSGQTVYGKIKIQRMAS